MILQQAVRFAAVGVLGFLLDAGVLSFGRSLLVNFTLSRLYVFRAHSVRPVSSGGQ